MKLRLLNQQVRVGTRVTLRLAKGDDVTGMIKELDEMYVRIDCGNREITIFEDLVAGWEVHDSGFPVNSALRPEVPEPASTPMIVSLVETEPESTHSPTPVSERAQLEPNLVQQLARIEAIFVERVLRSGLTFPEPDFQFDKSWFSSRNTEELQRDWVRVKNQYENAVRMKEIGRLGSTYAQVIVPLVENFPDVPAVRHLAGCILLKLERSNEAVEHFKFAAVTSGSSQYWYALAAATPAGSSERCIALRELFLLQRPDQHTEAWYTYVNLLCDYNDIDGFGKICHVWIEEKSHQESARLLVETLAYIFSRLLKTRPPSSLVSALACENGAFAVPAGWRDLLLEIGTPDAPELMQAERNFLPSRGAEHFSHRPAQGSNTTNSPTRTIGRASWPSDSPQGRIVSFGAQQFGFIDTPDGHTYFFRVDDVLDDMLRQQLVQGLWRSSPAVEFDEVPSPGHKYPRAVQVTPQRSSEEHLRSARELLKKNLYDQALALARRVLAHDPTNSQAQKLVLEVRERVRPLGAALPKGNGLYALAKRAYHAARDLGEAERLYRRAIAEDDNKETAVKALASLLQEQRRGAEAIELLEQHRKPHGSRRSPYDNMLATIYQHEGRHEDAIQLLRSFLPKGSPQARASLLRRIAFSYFKSSKFEQARETLLTLLKEVPEDHIGQRWLAGLEEAQKTGTYTGADELFSNLGGLAEEGVELSALARDAIDECTFEGVEPHKTQTGAFSERDVARLEDIAKGTFGTKVPRERAAYYLSAAAILARFMPTEESGRMYDYLRRYFASMGDAAWGDKKPADVVRAYYTESLSLVFDSTLDEPWRTLVRYLSTFCPEKLTEIEAAFPRARTIPRERYLEVLRMALRAGMGLSREFWLQGLLELATQSSFGARSLWDSISPNAELCQTLAVQLGAPAGSSPEELRLYWLERVREHGRNRQQARHLFGVLTKSQLSVASMEDLDVQLSNLYSTGLPELDRRRLGDLRDIVAHSLDFCRITDFEGRATRYWLVATRATKLSTEIRNAPTVFSHESLRPLAEHLRSLTDEGYAQLARSSVADLSVELIGDSYFPGPTGELSLQVGVSNRIGCSSANNIVIELGPETSPYFVAVEPDQQAITTLRGGVGDVAHVRLRPTPLAIEDRAFPVALRARYRDQIEDRITEERQYTVRLYDSRDFEEIPNIYAPYADGGAVEDEDLFMGRDEMLTDLEEKLNSRTNTKCIVLSGQKRAGKSSLLEHLRRRLERKQDCLPVMFSLLEMDRVTHIDFYWNIIDGICKALKRRDPALSPRLDLIRPSLDELKHHPTLLFHDRMSQLQSTLGESELLSSIRIVVLIDEFTEIFKQIKKQHISPDIMKAWKSIVEKRYFSSVLIGQDVMRTFQIEFGNEFAVSEHLRVNYLAESDARLLVERPIGAERLRGRATGRIFELTAGSPFYTVMLCSRLVDYINRTRSAIITEADVQAVEESMFWGDQRLTEDKFDNLIAAGDGYQDSGVDPKATYKLCAAIARAAERGTWCTRSSLTADDLEVDELLKDLERRDVVDRKGDAYRLRVGLFHDWLLVQG